MALTERGIRLTARAAEAYYLPYAYRHPEYWQKIQKESKTGGDKVASRKMFDESEKKQPIREEERIRAGKEHPKECRETRIDIDRRLRKALAEW